MKSDVSTLAWPLERDACGVGFVADTYGRKTHRVLQHALTALNNLSHRGAVSADGLTGDGAGVLTQLPHKLFRRVLEAEGISLGHDTDLAVGVFFVSNASQFNELYRIADEVIAASGLKLLLWREVPIDTSALGKEAAARLPVMRQVLVGRPDGLDNDAFERLLYLTRKRLERKLYDLKLGAFYIPSFSHRTLAYKGLMVAPQLPLQQRRVQPARRRQPLPVDHASAWLRTAVEGCPNEDANRNGVLESVAKADILDRLEPKTRLYYQIFARCADCQRIYWQGSHMDNMLKRLAGIGCIRDASGS